MSQSDPFYHTAAWQKAAEAALVRDNHLCQECLRADRITAAELVHHIKPFKLFPELALVLSNLLSLCKLCHRKIHYIKKKKEKKELKRRVRILKG